MLIVPLICNLHATIQRPRVGDHGAVVLGHQVRQLVQALALGLCEALSDGEHAVDDDCVYALLDLALRFG